MITKIEDYKNYLNENKNLINESLDFTKPNPGALESLDWYIQEQPNLQKKWDSAIMYAYEGPGSDYGWPGIYKEDPVRFEKAWDIAMEFAEKHDIDFSEIK